jgi:hypothetical protein
MRGVADVLTRVEVAERMTSEEFLRYAPEGQKAELVDGVMIMHSPHHSTCWNSSSTTW